MLSFLFVYFVVLLKQRWQDVDRVDYIHTSQIEQKTHKILLYTQTQSY